MKKVFISFTLATAVILTSVGCLKDQGFEDQKWGTQIVEVKGVALAQAASSPVSNSITGSPTPLTVDGPILTLETVGNATSDVQVTLQTNNAIVTAAGLTPVPAGAFTTPLTVTIPAGQKSVTVPITFANSTTLDPNITYGIGYVITAVSSGYIIVNNQKEVVFSFAVKNKYDGNYGLRIKTVGWSAYGISDNLPGTWPSTPAGKSIGLVTAGANSVRVFDYVAFNDYIQPAFTANNSGPTGFGATAPRFIFNTTTNQLTNVVNDLPDDGRGRTFFLNPAVTTSRYDPATKTIYAAYVLTQNGRPNLMIFDTLTYKGPR